MWLYFDCGPSTCESTETNEKFRALIRSHVSMMTTVTIVISVITKIKNSNSNNSDY